MNKTATPAREKVIKQTITEIREAVIKTQLEIEYLESCISRANEARNSFIAAAQQFGGIDVTIDENTNPTLVDIINAYQEVCNVIESMTKVVTDQRAVEHSLILKLNFFKEKRNEFDKKKEAKKQKRTERFIEESKQLLECVPDKICVDTSEIKYKKPEK